MLVDFQITRMSCKQFVSDKKYRYVSIRNKFDKEITPNTSELQYLSNCPPSSSVLIFKKKKKHAEEVL